MLGAQTSDELTARIELLEGRKPVSHFGKCVRSAESKWLGGYVKNPNGNGRGWWRVARSCVVVQISGAVGLMRLLFVQPQ